MSISDAIAAALHISLFLLEAEDTFIRILFINYSSVIPRNPAQLYTLRLNPTLCDWLSDILTGRQRDVMCATTIMILFKHDCTTSHKTTPSLTLQMTPQCQDGPLVGMKQPQSWSRRHIGYIFCEGWGHLACHQMFSDTSTAALLSILSRCTLMDRKSLVRSSLGLHYHLCRVHKRAASLIQDTTHPSMDCLLFLRSLTQEFLLPISHYTYQFASGHTLALI